ncbi:hypothetical protein FNH22_28270 [Fulvivirga sp. M361]|uniref:hypothetical protein n=1 Tax=Fulvivirga sp. M361 TaxID=2594266 RepID=UPI00117A01D9|nr:hypothetical protein [Fulvivirga sp. M361]TRX48934.1 hypothetical protein FNH22_28270 [Fulvivirga sp. M361]
MKRVVIYGFIVLLSKTSLLGQKYNGYLGLELGVSATHSFWEGNKPNKNEIRLQHISQASPNFQLLFTKQLSPRFWMYLGARAQPVSWKYSRYQISGRYKRRRRSLTTFGIWHFSLIASYEVKKIVIKKRFPAQLFFELGPLVYLGNGAKSSLNNGSLNLTTNTDSLTSQQGGPNYDDGKWISVMPSAGVSLAVKLPNKKLLTLRGSLGVGTRTSFREFVDRDRGYTIKSNGSFMQMSIGYLFPLKTKGKQKL